MDTLATTQIMLKVIGKTFPRYMWVEKLGSVVILLS